MHTMQLQIAALGGTITAPAGGYIKVLQAAVTTAGTIVGNGVTLTTTVGMVLPYSRDGWVQSSIGGTIVTTGTGVMGYVVYH